MPVNFHKITFRNHSWDYARLQLQPRIKKLVVGFQYNEIMNYY